MDILWGVITHKGEYIEVSKTQHGAKCYATRNGYTRIGARPNGGYNVINVLVRVGNRWINEQ